jgi:hypothetical protein
MSLSGGVQSISGILAVAGLCGLLYICSPSISGARRGPALLAESLLPLGLATYCVAIYLVSFVATPYSPRYGAVKLLYITTCISVPLIPACLSMLMRRFNASTFAHISIAPLALVTLALFDPGRVFFSWPKSVELKADWANTVVREISRKPDRQVMCLNTTTDLGQDIWAYICSRMAAGLQGLSTEGEDGESDYPVWTASNIYGAPPEQGAAAWDENFYRTLTVLVFDPNRRDNGDPRQLAWLADVDWTAVRIIGPDGNVIKRAGVPPNTIGP